MCVCMHVCMCVYIYIYIYRSRPGGRPGAVPVIPMAAPRQLWGVPGPLGLPRDSPRQATRGLKMAKKASRGPGDAQDGPTTAQEAPKTAQEAAKTPRQAPKSLPESARKGQNR